MSAMIEESLIMASLIASARSASGIVSISVAENAFLPRSMLMFAAADDAPEIVSMLDPNLEVKVSNPTPVCKDSF